MEKKLIIPAATFLVGLAAWIVLFILFLTNDWGSLSAAWPRWTLGLLPGALIAYSGIHCRQVGGPKIGNIVRSGVLLVLAVITWWKVGALAAIILLVAALVTGALAISDKSDL